MEIETRPRARAPFLAAPVQACMKENKEKKIKNCDEISKLIKAFPKDIAALDKRSVLAKVNSQGSGR